MNVDDMKAYELNPKFEKQTKLLIDVVFEAFLSSSYEIRKKYRSVVFGKLFFIEKQKRDEVTISIIGNDRNDPYNKSVKKIRKFAKDEINKLIEKEVFIEVASDRLAKYFLLGGEK